MNALACVNEFPSVVERISDGNIYCGLPNLSLVGDRFYDLRALLLARPLMASSYISALRRTTATVRHLQNITSRLGEILLFRT